MRPSCCRIFSLFFFFFLSRSDGVGRIGTYLKKNGRRLAKLAASCNPKPYTITRYSQYNTGLVA